MGLDGWEESCALTRKRVNYGLGSRKSFLKLSTGLIRSTVQIHNISLAGYLSFHLMLMM